MRPKGKEMATDNEALIARANEALAKCEPEMRDSVEFYVDFALDALAWGDEIAAAKAVRLAEIAAA